MKDEDGSEIHCRWCGGIEDGRVFCCSTKSCPFVFCSNCIRFNFSDDLVNEIEKNDDWFCFVCDKNALKHHRAQHWAVQNFISKHSFNAASRACPLKNRQSSAIYVPTDTPKSSAKNAKQSPLKLKARDSIPLYHLKNVCKSKTSSAYTPLKYRIVKGKFVKVKENTSAKLSSQRHNITAPASTQPAKAKTPTKCNNFMSKTSEVTQTLSMENAKLKVEDALKVFLNSIKEITDWTNFTQVSDIKEFYTHIELSFKDAFNNVKAVKSDYEHECEDVKTDKNDNETLNSENQDSATNKASIYENIVPVPLDDATLIDKSTDTFSSFETPRQRFIMVRKFLCQVMFDW